MNNDSAIDLSDAVFTPMYLFQEGKPPPCPDAADVNDDRLVDISDPIITDGVAFLNFLFLGGHAPPCEDAVDGNDDGVLNMDDLCIICPPCCPFLWIVGPPPLLPAPRECGPDPTPDRLGCNSSPCGY